MDKSGTRSTGLGLRVARALLVVVALALLALWIGSLPEYFRRASTLTIPTLMRAGEVLASNEMIQAAAIARGLSLSSYLIYETGLSLLTIGVFFGVAGLIVGRAKRSWFGWLTALVLLGLGTTSMAEVLHVVQPPAGILVAIEALGWCVWPVMFLWIYLFPSGGAGPRWTRTPVGITLVTLGIGTSAGFLASFGELPKEAERLFSQIGPVLVLGMLGLIVYSQIYRYRHSYSHVEREQVKWFVFAIVVLLAQIILFVLSGLLGSEPSAIVQDISGELPLLLPLSVGFAVLRYRLYDIDLIINRTLVYAPLTAIVAGLMAAGVKLSQTAFIAVTGKESDVAVVAATFVVVSLSTPIRNRLQALVDRSFKDIGDAERRLGKFSERVSEVVEVVDPGRIGRHAVEECIAALDADGGALYRGEARLRRLIYKSEGWQDAAQLEVAIPDDLGKTLILSIGRRRSGAPYSPRDRQAVETLARAIAPALAWGKPAVAANPMEGRIRKGGGSAHPRPGVKGRRRKQGE